MRMRTTAVAALAAATLTIGGSAAAYASAPAPPPPPGAKATLKVFSCKDGVIKLEESRLVDAGGSGAVFSIEDGKAVAGSAGPRVQIMQVAPADGPAVGAAPAKPLPQAGVDVVEAQPLAEAGGSGVVTRVHQGDDVPFAEPKEGEPCSALAVPALPTQSAQPAK